MRRLARKRSHDIVLAEGHRALRCALEAGARVREVFAAPSLFLGGDDPHLVALAEHRGARIAELSEPAFRSVASNARPDGILAVVERPSTALARLDLPPAPLLLVAEAIERPGNLGTIVRSVCAAGADGLLACDAHTDPFHPEVVRGSVGTVFSLQLAAARSERALAWLRERDVRIVVATPSGARPYWKADYAGAIALVVGNERYGVGETWLLAADDTVAIPMPGAADSLNVAVAAGIVLFEAVRCRSAPLQSHDRDRVPIDERALVDRLGAGARDREA